MTTIKTYIPILRWRPAEIKALEKLFQQDRENVTPLIEFVVPAPSTKNQDGKSIITKTSREKFLEALPNVSKDLLKSCGQNSVFVDVHLLESTIRASSLEQILSSSNELNSIPVTYIFPVASSDADMATRTIAVNYAKSTGHGICIRIDKSHLEEKNISLHIANFVEDNGLDIENADLLVDLGVINQNTTATDITKQLTQIPDLDKWRSFIMSGGVFPKNLMEFIPGKAHELNRLDWQLWKTIRDNTLLRTPLFSDYTIQCPNYERIDAIGSVSVRYTDDDKWWIFRGKKPGLVNPKTKEKGPGLEQYVDHARTLTGKSFSKFYKCANYSFGDSEIARIAASDNKKPGNAATWLTIGINHHITLVARQVSSLAAKTEGRSAHIASTV
ncbi:MAG: beta family protein [bacterium]